MPESICETPDLEELHESNPEEPATEPELHETLAQHLKELGAETDAERTVKRVIPWLSSVFLHAGLIVLGFVIVFAVRQPEEEAPQEVVADWRNLTWQPLTEANPNQAEETVPELQNRTPLDTITEALDAQLRDLEVDPIHLLSDAASEQQLAEFAPQPQQGTARFAGLTGTNARRIVFLVDASGSMIGTLQIIIEELSRSIDQLVPEQSFAVVFFQNNRAVMVPPETRLIAATPDEKIRALKWIDEFVVPDGRSNPVEALRKGLSLEPDLIFLLSNNITGSGQFEIDQDDLLAMLEELNPIEPATGRRRTQIQCVQFLDPDPLDTLKRIAEIHGGPNGYRFLSRRELGLGGSR